MTISSGRVLASRAVFLHSEGERGSTLAAHVVVAAARVSMGTQDVGMLRIPKITASRTMTSTILFATAEMFSKQLLQGLIRKNDFKDTHESSLDDLALRSSSRPS